MAIRRGNAISRSSPRGALVTLTALATLGAVLAGCSGPKAEQGARATPDPQKVREFRAQQMKQFSSR